MTAALNYKTIDRETSSAFLGVERSARGLRWVERLDPSRVSTALAIAQAHGLPELVGRLLAARGADAATPSNYLDPSLRHLLPDPASLQDMYGRQSASPAPSARLNPSPSLATTTSMARRRWR